MKLFIVNILNVCKYSTKSKTNNTARKPQKSKRKRQEIFYCLEAQY